jgi:hypothetical protein
MGLTGCMTLTVEDASDKSERLSQFDSAGVSSQQVFVWYEVDINGNRLPRCAEWGQKDMGGTNQTRVLMGKLVSLSTNQNDNIRPVALVDNSLLHEMNTSVETNCVVVEMQDDPLVDLQLRPINGPVVRQRLEVPVNKHSHAAWGYVIMPFAVVGDVATSPIQAIIFGCLYAAMGPIPFKGCQ